MGYYYGSLPTNILHYDFPGGQGVAISQNDGFDSRENILMQETEFVTRRARPKHESCHSSESRGKTAPIEYKPSIKDLRSDTLGKTHQNGRNSGHGGVGEISRQLTAGCSEDNYVLVIDSRHDLAVSMTPCIPLMCVNEEIRQPESGYQSRGLSTNCSSAENVWQTWKANGRVHVRGVARSP